MFPGFMVPSKSGKISTSATDKDSGCVWGILAPAKLNLYLEVLGPRDDGFHSLETLMVPVRLYDQIYWSKGRQSQSENGFTLRINNLLANDDQSLSFSNKPQENLVLRAGQLLAETAGINPRGNIDLIKRIPVEAGLGGGSSDAAATLLLLNQAWGLNYTQAQLLPLAAELGSDVPFFLSRTAAICRGRGELLEPVAGLPRMNFVIVKPEVGLSTALVFKQLAARTESHDELAASSSSRLSELIGKLQSGSLASAGAQMTNRLESAAQKLATWLVQLRERFSKLGCVGHFMTGSGSAYVGVMRTASQTRRAAHLLRSLDFQADIKIESVFATSSC